MAKPKARAPNWTETELNELRALYLSGVGLAAMAEKFPERSTKGVEKAISNHRHKWIDGRPRRCSPRREMAPIERAFPDSSTPKFARHDQHIENVAAANDGKGFPYVERRRA